MALTCASAFTSKAPSFVQTRGRTTGRVALPLSPVCSSRRVEQTNTQAEVNNFAVVPRALSWFEIRRAGCPAIKPASSFPDVIVPVQASLIKLAGVSTAVSTLLAAGNAQAAQEVAALAARDNRASTLLLLLAPALGWVAFNILSPALNQLKGMQNAKRSAAIGLGLSAAALLSAQNADAAEEIAQVSCAADCITCCCC